MKNGTGLETPVWCVVSACVITCGLLTGCAVAPSVVRDLPELPAEFARDLVVARTAPVLITKPAAKGSPVEPRPAATPLPLVPARACTAVYDGYVTYPITVCFPPSILYDALVLDVTTAPALPGRPPVPPASHFKLGSHPQLSLALPPWLCSVRSGPWYGHVEGQQICGINPNTRLFTATILGAPEPVLVTWTGALEDVPAPLNLFGISQTGEFCTCCSGVMCPDQSCKPTFDLCDTRPPAIK